MAAPFLQLKWPYSIRHGLRCLHSGPIPRQFPIAKLGGEIFLQQRFASLSENSRGRRGFGLGLGRRSRIVIAVAGEEGERSEPNVAPEPIRERSEENNSHIVPSELQDLTLHRRDPPNLFLYAAGFCGILLLRDVIFRELAGRGINFGPIALAISEGLAIGLGKLTNVLAEPIAFLFSVLGWAIMAVTDIYTLIVDAAPVKALVDALLLSLAVLSIGDATSCKIQGSRSRLVGLAAAVGLAGAVEFIPAEAVLLCLALLTAFAKLVQKADMVTVVMPATVTLVAISEPVLRAAAFAAFLAVSVYENWRFAVHRPAGVQQEAGEATTPSQVRELEARAGMRESFVFVIISASICISWAARVLYLRSEKWLLLRSMSGR